jgi:hypothetical protein
MRNTAPAPTRGNDAYADGAPNYGPSGYGTPPPTPPPARRPLGGGEPPTPKRYSSESTEVATTRRVEGPRGYSARAAVWLRYLGFLAGIVLCSAITEVVTAGIPNAARAGAWMFASCTVMSLSAAVGTMAFPANRLEVLEQWRHFLFGISLLPGTGIAVFMWATEGLFKANSTDAFAGLMSNALPILYFITVVLPTLIFIKWVAGQRTIYRSRMDDQEMVSIWTRQTGGYQR